MEVQFVDRILTCSDCHSEFVFTAGEQLFFYDKQFKNDPKRCKPCKSRRSGLSVGATTSGLVGAGISRTETRTECDVQTTVPFKPTQGRPVLCRQCFQAKNKLAAPAQVAKPIPSPPLPVAPISPEQTAAALSSASMEADGGHMSADSAIGAAASIAGASPESSVATAADLASIGPIPPVMDATQIPTELLVAGNDVPPSEQIGARVEVAEA